MALVAHTVSLPSYPNPIGLAANDIMSAAPELARPSGRNQHMSVCKTLFLGLKRRKHCTPLRCATAYIED